MQKAGYKLEKVKGFKKNYELKEIKMNYESESDEYLANLSCSLSVGICSDKEKRGATRRNRKSFVEK